jgi:Fe-S-cluster containining protein
MEEILASYRDLLAEVDRWFAACLSRFPDDIACVRGCSSCCRGLFDITLLDAYFLRRGFDQLPEEVRLDVLDRARKRLSTVREIWPEFAPPFILNNRPEEEWRRVMPEDDTTPCVLLGSDGLCLIYDCRPLTCRLHGLPHVDSSGEVMDDEWCTLNFAVQDPLVLTGLCAEFAELFRRETVLLGEFNALVTGLPIVQLDTLIPAALLIDSSVNDNGQRSATPFLR